MITAQPYRLPVIIPPNELREWKERIRQAQPRPQCPPEVAGFIEALAEKLGDFGQMRTYREFVPGRLLMLSGIREMNGERINAWDLYPLTIPHMIAVDHYTSMHRIYRRKGKQGLIDYCKAHVKGSELEHVLQALNVHVFDVHRPEYERALKEIKAAKKIDHAESL